MKKLHLLFLKSFLGPFLGTFFIALFLFLMETVWKYINDLVGKGLELTVILEFFFYSAIHLIPMALPLAILLSTIMTFGNLGERYELVAVKSAGISLIKAMRPLFVFAILLSIAAFFTTNNVIPKANLNWGALLYDILSKKPSVNIVENVFFTGIDGYAIKVGKKHKDKIGIEDVLIYAQSAKKTEFGNQTVVMAQSGKMYITPDSRYMMLELYDGKRYSEMVDDPEYYQKYQHNIMQFDSYKMSFDLSDMQFSRSDKELFKDDYRMLNVKELIVKEDSLSKLLERNESNMVKYIMPYYHLSPDSILVDNWDLEKRKSYLKSKKTTEVAQEDTTLNTVYVPDFRNNQKIVQEERLKNTTVEMSVPDQKFEVENIDERSIARIERNQSNIKDIISSSSTEIKYNRKTLARFIAERYKKYTLALSCIILFFVGAPLGALIRKGGFGLPFVVSILIFIVYYVTNVVGEKMIREDTVTPFVGMWMSTFIFLPLAVFLTYKASTDSPIFDAEFYQKISKYFQKVLRKFPIKKFRPS